MKNDRAPKDTWAPWIGGLVLGHHEMVQEIQQGSILPTIYAARPGRIINTKVKMQGVEISSEHTAFPCCSKYLISSSEKLADTTDFTWTPNSRLQ